MGWAAHGWCCLQRSNILRNAILDSSERSNQHLALRHSQREGQCSLHKIAGWLPLEPHGMAVAHSNLLDVPEEPVLRTVAASVLQRRGCSDHLELLAECMLGTADQYEDV